MESPRPLAGRRGAGAVVRLAGATVAHVAATHPGSNVDPQWQRGAEHLHGLGARALCEFLRELALDIDGEALLLAKLDLWRARLTPAMIRAAGADRFPPALNPLEGGR